MEVDDHLLYISGMLFVLHLLSFQREAPERKELRRSLLSRPGLPGGLSGLEVLYPPVIPDLPLTRLVLEVPRGRAYPVVPGVQVSLFFHAGQVYRDGLGSLLVLFDITRDL